MMESLLRPVYDVLPLQILFGLLLGSNVAFAVFAHYSTLLWRQGIDLAGLALYLRSGLWLSALLASVAAFLPSFLSATAGAVLTLVTLTSTLVGRVESRLYSGT